MDILFCCKLIVDSPVGLFYAILQKPKSLSCLYYVGQEVGRARNRPPINICLYTSHFAGSIQHWLFQLSFPRHLISRFSLIFFCAVVSSQNGIPRPPCGHGWGFSWYATNLTVVTTFYISVAELCEARETTNFP
jgi:hypothetical protein